MDILLSKIFISKKLRPSIKNATFALNSLSYSLQTLSLLLSFAERPASTLILIPKYYRDEDLCFFALSRQSLGSWKVAKMSLFLALLLSRALASRFAFGPLMAQPFSNYVKILSNDSLTKQSSSNFPRIPIFLNTTTMYSIVDKKSNASSKFRTTVKLGPIHSLSIIRLDLIVRPLYLNKDDFSCTKKNLLTMPLDLKPYHDN